MLTDNLTMLTELIGNIFRLKCYAILMQDLKSAVLKSVRHAKGTGGGPPVSPPYVEEMLQILGDKKPLVSGIEGLCMKIFMQFLNDTYH